MDRAGVLLYLQSQLGQLATAAKLTHSSDRPEGFRLSIDQAFRALGVAEADLPTATVADTMVGDLFALARYYGLEALLTHLATAVDIAFDAPAMSKKRSQLFTQVSKLLDRAQADMTSRGYGPQDFTAGRYSLDFLEPSRSEMG